MRDYKGVINNWVINKKIHENVKLLIHFFRNGFVFTKYPDMTYFGPSKSSISFMIGGGIYLLAYVHTGIDKGIWMLQDRIHDNLEGGIFDQHEAKSTKNLEQKLYWLHAQKIEDLAFIIENDSIWNSYQNASELIKITRYWNFVREDYTKNKEKLTLYWKYTMHDIPSKESFDEAYQKQLEEFKAISADELKRRMAEFNRKPEKIEVLTHTYIRNPYVVIGVLNRSQGICESCKDKAPFIRKKDGTPYLEIHHLVPLSENGDDTLENAVALCPNCHRKMHYGI
ncbi:MAG: HNH endonuclease [Desulfosporosinus sp.]|nr:HNH endonuclease [Desulfosporosinus sp.]